IPGANPIGANGGFGGGLSGGPTGPGAFSPPSTLGGSSGFGANSNSPSGQNQQTTGNAPAGSDASQPSSQPGSQQGSQSSSNATGDGAERNPSGTGNGNSGSNQLGSGQIIGGPIVGVASISKDATIREFNHQ